MEISVINAVTVSLPQSDVQYTVLTSQIEHVHTVFAPQTISDLISSFGGENLGGICPIAVFPL